MCWLKRSIQCAAFAFALLACSTAASAQELSRGYFFLEVLDEAGKPVSGASAVVYDSTGREAASSVTEAGGARLFQNSSDTTRYIFRVIKSGFVTYEGTFVTSGTYRQEHLRVKLIRLPALKPKAGDARHAATEHTQIRAGPSPEKK